MGGTGSFSCARPQKPNQSCDPGIRMATKTAMAKPSNPSFEFVKNYLTKHPTAAYADVRDAASRAGHTIYPIV